MELDIKEDLRLVDHLNKCRCCFEKFNYIGNQVEISEIIEEQFLELTQIELISSPSYSKSVCLKCTNELQSISNFRLDLITKQQKLYDFVTTSAYDIQDAVKFEPVYIKIETESTDELDNIFKFDSQYEEIENYEVPVSHQLKTIETQKNAMTEIKPNVKKVHNKLINEKQEINVSKAVHRVIFKEKRFFCYSCDYGTNSKSDIAKHVSTHVPKLFRKLTCVQCEFVTISDQVMKSHNRMFHGHENKNIKQFKKKSNSIKQICPHCGIMMANLSCHIRGVHFKEKRFFCDSCNYGTNSKSDIAKHVLTHVPKLFRKLSCDQCAFKTISDQVMKSHNRMFHGHENKNIKQVKKKSNSIKQICPHCGIMMANLSCHIRGVHFKEKRFFCDSCNYGTNSKSDIAKHVLTHVPKLFRKLSCDQCAFKTISDQVMKSHYRKYHSTKNKIIVGHCGKRFIDISIYNKHTQQKHNKKPKVEKKSNSIKEICSYCGIITRNLSSHIRRVHLNVKRFFCDLCNYGTIFKSDIVEHMKTHLPSIFREKLHCSKCKYKTKSLHLMRSHVRSYCKEIKEKDEYVCYCGKVFGTKAVLNKHKSYAHEPRKKQICTICDKVYSSASLLNVHMKQHTGKRDLTCEVCGKKFVTLLQLKQHSMYHEERKFVCTFEGCTKKFFTVATLEGHKKTHLDQRDFACHLCDKKYFKISSLNHHMSNVHEQLKYVCEVPG